jgi:hypothetical protein
VRFRSAARSGVDVVLRQQKAVRSARIRKDASAAGRRFGRPHLVGDQFQGDVHDALELSFTLASFRMRHTQPISP